MFSKFTKWFNESKFSLIIYNRNARELQALAQHKLIPLYLMDSIVKNVGGAYSSLFMTNLTPTFCDAFGVVDNKTRQSFIKLLDTWQTQSVFSQQKNDEIRLRLAALLSAEASNERAQIPAPVIPPPNVAQPMAPPAHAPFPRHAMGNLPVNDVNPNFVHGFRGPASVQEQLAVSQSRVHSLLGTLQPGPPQIPMHLPPPMQAQHHPAPVIMQQGGWPQAPQPQMPMHPPQHHPMSMNMNQGFHHHPVQNNQFVQPLQPQHPQPGPQSHFPQPALAAPLPPPATPHPLQMTGFHPQQINLQPRVPDHSRPMQSTGSLFGTVRSLNANDLGSQDVSPVIRGLYDDQPHECKSDGRRFRAKEDLQKHLDKLFAINKARKDCTGIKERQWFRRMEDWVSCADVIERPATTPAQDVKDANRMEVEITMSVEKAAEEEENAEKVPAEEFDHGTRYRGCFARSSDVTSKLAHFRTICFIVFPARLERTGLFLRTIFMLPETVFDWSAGRSSALTKGAKSTTELSSCSLRDSRESVYFKVSGAMLTWRFDVRTDARTASRSSADHTTPRRSAGFSRECCGSIPWVRRMSMAEFWYTVSAFSPETDTRATSSLPFPSRHVRVVLISNGYRSNRRAVLVSQGACC